MESASNALPEIQSRRRKIASLIVFDTETSSIGSDKKITELCFLSVQTDEVITMKYPRVVNELKLCFNPQCVISPAVITCTGLYNDHLEHMPTFRDAAPLVTSFLACQPRPMCIIAHNGNRFDFPLIHAELQEAGQPLAADPDVLCADSLEAFRMLDGLPAVPEWMRKKEMEEKKCGNPAGQVLDQEQGSNNNINVISSCPAVNGTTGSSHPVEDFKATLTNISPSNNKRADHFEEDSSDLSSSSIPPKQPKLAEDASVLEFSSQLSVSDSQLTQVYDQGDSGPGSPPQVDSYYESIQLQGDPNKLQPVGEQTPPKPIQVPSQQNVAKQFVKKGQPSYSSVEERDRVSRRLFDSNISSSSGVAADCQMPQVSCLPTVPLSKADTIHITTDIADLNSQGSIPHEDFLAVIEEAEAAMGVTSLPMKENTETVITSPVAQDAGMGDGDKQNITNQNYGHSGVMSRTPISSRNDTDSGNTLSENACDSSTSPKPTTPAAAAPSPDSGGKVKDSSEQRSSQTPVRVSYKLGEIYQRVYGRLPEQAHTAEDDCKTLLHIILNRAPEFMEWLSEHAVPLHSLQP